jgi:pimeloyl-ACP methyl ester carboxylesterase
VLLLCFATFIESRELAPLVVGGVSLGAAIALRLAVRRPELVCGLILARPAWVTRAAPDNMKPNAKCGARLRRSTRRPGRSEVNVAIENSAASPASDAPCPRHSRVRRRKRGSSGKTSAVCPASPQRPCCNMTRRPLPPESATFRATPERGKPASRRDHAQAIPVN